MTLRIAAVVLAGLVGLGCSSAGKDGAPGPAGPTGPTGLAGPAGATGPQGQAGVSVTSSQLAVGSTDCPNGGSQFTSTSGTTFACNGAQGEKGAAGASAPVLVAKAGATTIGPAFPVAPFGSGIHAVGVYVAPGAFVLLDPDTGRSILTTWVYFVQPDCTGDAYILKGNTSPANAGRLYAVEAYGTTRVFAPTGPATERIYSQSRLEPNPITGAPFCQTAFTNGTIPVFPATELPVSFPLGPINLALE